MKSNIAAVRTNVKFAADDVRLVRFVSYEKKVTVTSRGLPKLTIKAEKDGSFVAGAKWNGRTKIVKATGKTPEQAYKRIVAAAWTN